MDRKSEVMKETPSGGVRPSAAGRQAIDSRKSAAKIGMSLSMGALAATGLMRGRGAKTLHIWSGMALVGFAFWHYHLYQPGARRHRQ